MMPQEPLRLTSMMSENENFIFEAIAQYIGKQIGVPVQVIDRISWKEREGLLDSGKIDVAWICGLPYVLRADRSDPEIELLAAPVMSGERYLNRPIYFSDVVVHQDSQFRQFADLKGASWAYNEPFSHSGYNVVRYHLAAIGQTGKYFGRVVESGSHLRSLQMILKHEKIGRASCRERVYVQV
jgi:phosphonate transport system substrate-binding protein